jgi:hypothetical protein
MATELSNGNWVGISVVSGVIIASLIGGIGTGIQNATRAPSSSYVPPVVATPETPSDLAQGDPGSPFAMTPLTCATACFGEDDLGATILGADQFVDAEVPYTHPPEVSTTAIDVQPVDLADWDDSGISPDECFVTWSESPIVEPAGAVLAPDFVAPLTDHTGDADTRLVQSVRLFADSDAAEAYMTALFTGLASCPEWRTVSNGVERPVFLAPALRTAPSVASYGFVVEPQDDERRFVFDLQRGNMVVRSVLITSLSYDDQLFRELVREQADAMDALEPAL